MDVINNEDRKFILKILLKDDWKTTRQINSESNMKNWNKVNLILTVLLFEDKIENMKAGASIIWRLK